MDLPRQCLEPSFLVASFFFFFFHFVFPLSWVTFILYSDQELFWLHRQQVAMFIGVFHLPILVIAKGLLIKNFKKELKTPVTNELSISWTVTSGCRHLLISASNHRESGPSNWSFVSSFSTSSSKQYSFAQWTFEHFNRTKSTAWREMESVGSSCCNFQLWCWLSKNPWVLEQRAWKPVAGSCSGSRLDSPASICWVSCHDYAHVKHLYVF